MRLLAMFRSFIHRLLATVYGGLAFILVISAIQSVMPADPAEPRRWMSALFFLALAGWFGRLCVRRCREVPQQGAHGGKRSSAPSTKEFFARVVGVTQLNADGTSRQDLIAAHCQEGLRLELRREPSNPHDGNAIAVHCLQGQIGYLDAELAKEYVSRLDRGKISLGARIKTLTGGTAQKPTRGVNLVIEVQRL
jgi:HIRAN domain